MVRLLLLAIFGLVVSVSNAAVCDASWEPLGDRCFFFGDQKLAYQEARNYCGTLHDLADLGIVADSNTLRDIYKYILQFGLKGNFWVGGTDAVFEGDWKWVDGSRVVFGSPFWALENGLISWSQEPLGGTAQNCVILDASRYYYMDDYDCFSKNHAICMY